MRTKEEALRLLEAKMRDAGEANPYFVIKTPAKDLFLTQFVDSKGATQLALFKWEYTNRYDRDLETGDYATKKVIRVSDVHVYVDGHFSQPLGVFEGDTVREALVMMVARFYW